MKMNRNAMIVLASVSSVMGACAPNTANTEAASSSGAAASTNPGCTATSDGYSVRFDVPGLVNVSNDQPPESVTVGKLIASSRGNGNYHLGRSNLTLKLKPNQYGRQELYEGFDQASQGTNPVDGRFRVTLRLEKGSKSGLYQFTTFSVDDRGNASGAGKRTFNGTCPISNAVSGVADQSNWINRDETARTDGQAQNRITNDTLYCWLQGRTFKPASLEGKPAA